ncbi:hypothetical protein BOX15_Mlig023719g1 [Macrostomum lignano]|uniref:TOG domain-containing protein n=1 Tax=Macrostomum lignano TaxID=282301 RepID=A0A267F760_9PLAT|nr:hypothetical protein BOX15_Mlig023719g1 [Macrostomum lignano]
MPSIDDLIRELSRSFELLSDGEATRFQRKKSLETIWTKSKEHFSSLASDRDAQQEQTQQFLSYSTKFLASSFSDQTELIREKSIDIVTYFVQNTEELPQAVCTTIVNILVGRLGQNQKDVVEPSEELRLKMSILLDALINKLQKNSHLYLSEFTQVIVQILDDAFHEVKKQACNTLSNLAKLTEGYFHPFTEKFIKPLLHNIAHQHSRVRKDVIRTVGDVIQYGSGKHVDDVLSHLAQRLFDDSPLVREEVINVVGTWLLDLPDRYSFFHKLIPLLLTGLSDEIPSIVEKSEAFWDDIGAKFEAENEEDLKDKQDFATLCPEHYPVPPAKRPNLGCRTLVNRNLSKILPPLSRDLTDWVASTRLKSAQLLPHLILAAESYTTQHLETLLTAAYRAAADDEAGVRRGVDQAIFYASHFAEPSLWWRLVGPHVKRSADGNRQLASALRVLTRLLAGAEPRLARPLLPEVAAALAASDVACGAYGLDTKWRLLKCLDSLVGVCDSAAIEEIAEPVYYTILAVMTLPNIKDDAAAAVDPCDGAQPPQQALLAECRQLLGRLSERLGLPDPACLAALHRKYFGTCLARLKRTFTDWTKHSYERAILDTLCLEAGPVVGAHLPDLMEVFRVCLHVDKDVELRLKLFLLLARLCARSAETVDSCGQLPEHIPDIIGQLILPNCRWRAGRTAEAIRRVAVACLWTLLSAQSTTDSDSTMSESLKPVLDELLTALGSLMEDDSQETRHLASRCLGKVLATSGPAMDADKVHQFYPSLVKRLDDSSDAVRLSACEAWLVWLGVTAQSFRSSPDLYAAHLQDIYRGLLVHLDDQDSRIRSAVYGVLAVAGRLHSRLLAEEVQRVRHKHRDEALLTRLLDECQRDSE